MPEHHRRAPHERELDHTGSGRAEHDVAEPCAVRADDEARALEEGDVVRGGEAAAVHDDLEAERGDGGGKGGDDLGFVGDGAGALAAAAAEDDQRALLQGKSADLRSSGSGDGRGGVCLAPPTNWRAR